MANIPHHMVTTAFELPGYRVVRNLGVVRGIIVRSRSIVGSIRRREVDPRMTNRGIVYA